MIENLCLPTIIYFVYAMSHILIDISKGYYNTAFINVWVMLLFVLLLNLLCMRGLSLISWLMISIPFLFMTSISAVLLFVFGLNPATGTVIYDGEKDYEGKPPVKTS